MTFQLDLNAVSNLEKSYGLRTSREGFGETVSQEDILLDRSTSMLVASDMSFSSHLRDQLGKRIAEDGQVYSARDKASTARKMRSIDEQH